MHLSRRFRVVAATGLAVLGLAEFATSATASGTHAKRARATTGAYVSNAQVLASVKAAASITRVPSDLTPKLTDTSDIESLETGGTCPSSYHAPKVGIDAIHFGECTYGSAKGKHLMVMLGDSHAGMWLTAMKYAAARTGWRVRIFYYPGCPAPDLTFYSQTTNTPNYGCNTFRTDAIKAIRALHPNMVVVTSASLSQEVGRGVVATSSQWETGYNKTLSMLKMANTRLVVIGDIPILSQDDASCLAAHMTDVKACMTPISTAEQGVYTTAEAAAASTNGAQYVRTAPWICAQLCVPIVGQMRVYNDQYHLSATYAAYLSGALQGALKL